MIALFYDHSLWEWWLHHTSQFTHREENLGLEVGFPGDADFGDLQSRCQDPQGVGPQRGLVSRVDAATDSTVL